MYTPGLVYPGVNLRSQEFTVNSLYHGLRPCARKWKRAKNGHIDKLNFVVSGASAPANHT